MKKKIKYIKKSKPKDAQNIYVRFVVLENKVNQIVKFLLDEINKSSIRQ